MPPVMPKSSRMLSSMSFSAFTAGSISSGPVRRAWSGRWLGTRRKWPIADGRSAFVPSSRLLFSGGLIVTIV